MFEILIENQNIQNFYEFKHNNGLPIDHSNKIGFCARPEGRKNPHFLDGLKSFLFTESSETLYYWKEGQKIDFSKNQKYITTILNSKMSSMKKIGESLILVL